MRELNGFPQAVRCPRHSLGPLRSALVAAWISRVIFVLTEVAMGSNPAVGAKFPSEREPPLVVPSVGGKHDQAECNN